MWQFSFRAHLGNQKLRLICSILLALFLLPIVATAATIYLDAKPAGDCAGNYNPARRTCSGGSFYSWDTLDEIETKAAAGDTIIIRSGTYDAPSGNYVELESNQTWRANTGDARPKINCSTATGMTPMRGCFHVNGKSNVTIEGLEFKSCQQSCIRDANASSLTIKNNFFNDWNTTSTFTPGMQAGIFLLNSRPSTIESNQFIASGNSTQNAMKFGGGRGGNTCGHTIRYNSIDMNDSGSGNSIGIAVDVRCGSTTNTAGRNIIEYNLIEDTSTALLVEVDSASIIRRNIIIDFRLNGVRTRSHTYTNDRLEVYNNTFHTKTTTASACLTAYRVVDNYPVQKPGNFTNLRYYNNICMGSYDDMVVVWSAGVDTEPTNDINYNSYWNTHARNNLVCMRQPLGANNTRDTCRTGSETTIYTQSQIASYRSASRFDANSINADPQFVNLAGNDFNPGNAAFVDTGSTTVVSYNGSASDIGAIEAPVIASGTTPDAQTVRLSFSNINGNLSSCTASSFTFREGGSNCTPVGVKINGNTIDLDVTGTACDPISSGQTLKIDNIYGACQDSLSIGGTMGINGKLRAQKGSSVTNTIGGTSAGDNSTKPPIPKNLRLTLQ